MHSPRLFLICICPSLPQVRADDVFLFGSGTKPYTAAAVMRAVEAGQLHLLSRATPLINVSPDIYLYIFIYIYIIYIYIIH